MELWTYISGLLGPGLHWGQTKERLEGAIEKATTDGREDAAEHLRIILRLRNIVAFD